MLNSCECFWLCCWFCRLCYISVFWMFKLCCVFCRSSMLMWHVLCFLLLCYCSDWCYSVVFCAWVFSALCLSFLGYRSVFLDYVFMVFNSLLWSIMFMSICFVLEFSQHCGYHFWVIGLFSWTTYLWCLIHCCGL